MGCSQDLQNEGFRRVMVNATYWALGWRTRFQQRRASTSSARIIQVHSVLAARQRGRSPKIFERHRMGSAKTPSLCNGAHRIRSNVPAYVGFGRQTANTAVVHGREIRNLHPLGRLFGSALCAGRQVLRVVLELVVERSDRQREAERYVRVPQACLWREVPVCRTSLRCSRPSSSIPLTGRTSSRIRRKVRRADFQASRWIRAVAKRARQ